MALKWGIVGAGRISQDFVTAVKTLPESDHKVLAVAGRNKENVQRFAKQLDIERTYDDYGKLAADNDIDIVYIGNLNTQHFESAKLMLEHGKHVLCEKPFTMNEKQTTKLTQIAKERKLFLAEAVWSRSFPAYKKLKELMESGELGDVLFCSVNFGFPLQHVDRLTSKDFGGGAILDLGVYILQFQQWVFRGLKPLEVAVSGHKNGAGTDESAGVVLTYPEGKMAVVSTSARVALPNEGLVVGTKGSAKLPKFWCPTELITDEKSYEWPLPESPLPFLHVNSAGLSYEAEEARQCIKNGLIENPSITHQESIELARLMDLVRKQLGVVFPEDSQDF
ncbi:trans-1,2-dihydrobenzene-1,2-diol dehydrogenase-like [Anthonomus grandis grandis]|uniref:trans-1,2-dihydrobenzene-1,2-diol dehydrogenase-like n=1 Tax=Anthonomus grandis grandis TaxID=2921223 RepID=UPI002165B5F4|nr:trans-1,2-dihydrobenzene-1,2-diol dehydrogenase-like [Anthonomus grandis grandis]